MEQIVDIMTKCLSYDKFKIFRNQLGIMIPQQVGGVLKSYQKYNKECLHNCYNGYESRPSSLDRSRTVWNISTSGNWPQKDKAR